MREVEWKHPDRYSQAILNQGVPRRVLLEVTFTGLSENAAVYRAELMRRSLRLRANVSHVKILLEDHTSEA